MKPWNEADLIEIRHDLHQIPEIGLEEYKTQEYLLKRLAELPAERLEIRKWQTALAVKVKGKKGHKTLGWRTDIDGLPIEERTGLPYASKHSGRMHACGHDIHMTIALGILQEVVFMELDADVVVLFQLAEENEAGGMLLYEAGMLKGWEPDEFYALHIQPALPTGVISTKTGTLFAGTCEIQAHFIGKGGHAAFPHESNDMIIAASEFVQQAQTIVSRNVNPIEGAVVTFGTFEAGTTNNVIAGEAHVSGTIRTLTQPMNELTQLRMRQMAEGIAMSFQCEIDLVLDQKGYVPVENNEQTTKKFIDFVKTQSDVTFQPADVAMTGEDFGYLLSKIPGTMFWLGVDSPYSLHHEKLCPHEEAIPVAISLVSRYFKKQ